MHHKLLFISLFLFLAMPQKGWADRLPDDLNSAVAYAYFRVGDDDSTVPAISDEDFQSQMDEISNPANGYHPESLDTILKAQDNGHILPEKTITLTFEGEDSSFLSHAFPILTERHIPFTLFISPGQIDQGQKSGDPSILTWDDIRSIAKSDLATIGMTPYSYTHIDGKSAEALAADINRARDSFRTELRTEPKYFSYPFGEYTAAYLDVIKKQGFRASFGQQSGVISKSSSRQSLPRFTMADQFANLDRLTMTALSLPLPVTDLQPDTSVIVTNPPHPSFTIRDDIPAADIAKIKCFASGIQKVSTQKIGARHFEIRLSNGFDDSKGRLNCTIPAPPMDGSDDPRWRWLGFQFALPENM